MSFNTATTVRASLTAAFHQLDALFQLPPERLLEVPDAPDAWSIAMHLEHVSLANHFLLLTIGKGCRKARSRAAHLPVPDGESDLSSLSLSLIAVPGAFDWPPPLHMMPSGAVPLDDISSRLALQLQRCLELLDSIPRGEGRLCTISMSVHHLGRLDMYQWLYFLALHSRYHLTLIATRL